MGVSILAFSGCKGVPHVEFLQTVSQLNICQSLLAMRCNDLFCHNILQVLLLCGER